MKHQTFQLCWSGLFVMSHSYTLDVGLYLCYFIQWMHCPPYLVLSLSVDLPCIVILASLHVGLPCPASAILAEVYNTPLTCNYPTLCKWMYLSVRSQEFLWSTYSYIYMFTFMCLYLLSVSCIQTSECHILQMRCRNPRSLVFSYGAAIFPAEISTMQRNYRVVYGVRGSAYMLVYAPW